MDNAGRAERHTRRCTQLEEDRRTMQLTVTLTVAAVLLFAVAGMPAPAQPRGNGNGACTAEREKFCKDVEPGPGRIRRCLEEHEADLSAPCKQHLEHMQARTRAIEEACKDDVIKFCKSVSVGGFNLRNCLKRHEPELAPSCKTVLEETKQP